MNHHHLTQILRISIRGASVAGGLVEAPYALHAIQVNVTFPAKDMITEQHNHGMGSGSHA